MLKPLLTEDLFFKPNSVTLNQAGGSLIKKTTHFCQNISHLFDLFLTKSVRNVFLNYTPTNHHYRIFWRLISMMQIITVTFALLFLVPATGFAQSPNWNKVTEDTAAGIVRVHVIHQTRQHLKPYFQGDLQSRLGTGFFINDNQFVTNQHVVEGAHTIKIEGTLTHERFKVRLAAMPSLKFDLAVLEFISDKERQRFEQVNGRITPLEWADWAEAQPGDQVAVLGFGKSEKLVATQGIISNWEPRHDLYQQRLDHVTLIRTDAAVNTGNSGGPVVSDKGHVIGISARYGDGENIGFLIPFSTARAVTTAMLATGSFEHTDPGFVGYNINPVLRQILKVPEDQYGLVVSAIIPDSPAERAGLQRWDILTRVDGHEIKHGEIDHEYLGRLPYWFIYNTASTGTKLKIDVVREGQQRSLSINLAPTEMPRIWLPTEGEDYKPEWGYIGGIAIAEVTRELLEEVEQMGNWRWDLVNDKPRTGKLYLVVNIEPGTQAMSYQEYGLDILQLQVLSINGQPLNSDLQTRLAEIYKSVEAGDSEPNITIDFEKNLSIRLNAEELINDVVTLQNRNSRLGGTYLNALLNNAYKSAWPVESQQISMN